MQLSFSKPITQIGSFVLLLWGIELINTLSGHSLNQFGINPNSALPLPGILLAPLLHNGIIHLALNTLPLAIMAWLISFSGTKRLLSVSLFIVLVSGLGVWWFGRPGYHVGISGLIFGYLGYLIAHGLFTRHFGHLAISVITFLSYGGLIFGILPQARHISWEAHLMGLLAGVAVAWLFAKGKLGKELGRS